MSEESNDSGGVQERRHGTSRRSGEDRRTKDRGIRNTLFLKLFLDRRKGQDRRGGKDRRAG